MPKAKVIESQTFIKEYLSLCGTAIPANLFQ